MTEPKLVSVIIATYNRSNIISYSIKTVINQTYPHWELLVVGDCCTDDTEKVVSGFNDSRIKFYNLAKNVGEQSGPNNAGLSFAKGEYIAFLNHDDLWFEDHLSNLADKLESEDLDLVYSWWYAPRVPGTDNPIMAIHSSLSYDLKLFVPASCWLFKKHLIASVGYWKFFKEIYNVPSQEWLRRVYLRTSKIKGVPIISMIAVQSGSRLNSYKERQYLENAAWFEKLSSPSSLRIQLLTEFIVDQAKKDESVLYHFKSTAWTLMKRIIVWFNIQPATVRFFISFGSKGRLLNSLRLKRGLKKI